MIANLIAKRRLEHGTVIRIFAPSGNYWRENFFNSKSIYINESDLIFSACHFDRRPHEGAYYSEFDEPKLEELRLMAALTLPLSLGDGTVTAYPLRQTVQLSEQIDLLDAETIRSISDIIRSNIQLSGFPWVDGPLPPAFGGQEYSFRSESNPIIFQKRIYEAVDLSDYVLMRGIAALIKGQMLLQHSVFGEQAHHSLYIALDASFSLVLKKLRSAGISNPNAKDAASLIEDVFNEEKSGLRYFEEFYDDRIKVMHPSSRLGVFPYAPISNSDFFSLYYGLREIYRWLILDERVEIELSKESTR